MTKNIPKLLPSNWAESTLDQLGHLYCGQSSPVAEVNHDGLGTPYVTGPEQWDGNQVIENKWTEHPRRVVPEGCIFITVKGAGVGKMFPGIHAAIGRDIYAFKPHSEMDFDFVFFAIRHSIDAVVANAQGDIPGLSKSHILDHVVAIPGYDEQCRISEKIEELLSELDSSIDSLRLALGQLNVYRQALLKNVFEGKLTAKWREKGGKLLESGSELLDRINDERLTRYRNECREWSEAHSAWETSEGNGRRPHKPIEPTKVVPIETVDGVELPKLPYGWLWLRYGDLCSLVRNGISKKPVGTQGDKIFRISAVRPMEFDLDDFRYLKNPNGEYDSYYLATGDLIFTRYNGSRAYVGVCAEYKGSGEHLFPDKLIQTRLSSPLASSGFLEKALNCGASRRFVETRIRTTAGQSGVSGADIKSIPIPICGVAEQAFIQERLASELTNVAYLRDAIENALERTEALRQSVLKKAFAGKLVSQDPHDEPASVLLGRIRGNRAAQENGKNKIRRMAAA